VDLALPPQPASQRPAARDGIRDWAGHDESALGDLHHTYGAGGGRPATVQRPTAGKEISGGKCQTRGSGSVWRRAAALACADSIHAASRVRMRRIVRGL
jgi:hypothetical protein